MRTLNGTEVRNGIVEKINLPHEVILPLSDSQYLGLSLGRVGLDAVRKLSSSQGLFFI
jgi:hypothetical protein